MVAAKEILGKIEERRANGRKKAISETLSILDKASEMMLERGLTSLKLSMENGVSIPLSFEESLDFPEIKEALKENGYSVEMREWAYFLIIK